MVVAPHPDDESLATAGIVMRASALGAETRVLFVTDGENNPWPQRVLERRWRIRAEDRARWGRSRRAEAMSALACLGVPPDAARFLGYPDQQLSNLLMADPDPLLKDLVTEITAWRPSIVAGPAPMDLHPDHGALAVLIDFALAMPALREFRPALLRYIVHGLFRNVPDEPLGSLRLTLPEQDRKRRAILMHRSQLFLGGPRFLRFARPEECYLLAACPRVLDMGHNVTMCRMSQRELMLTIRKVRRPGIGPLVLQLALATETGTTMRAEIPLPPYSKTVLASSAPPDLIMAGSFTKSVTGTRLVLSLGPIDPPTLAYVKLVRPSERRLGLFDSVGWREIPVTPARTEVEVPAPRVAAVVSNGIPVP